MRLLTFKKRIFTFEIFLNSCGCLWLLVCCTAFFQSDLVFADNFSVNASLGLREEAIDNVFMTQEDKVDDIITTISPGLYIREQTERLTGHLNARWDGVLYLDNRELDAVEQFYNGDARYQLTPRLSVSTSASYTKDSRPDRDIDSSGLLLANIDRSRYGGSFESEYRFSERTACSFSYAYSQDDYDQEFLDFNPDYRFAQRASDYMGHIAGIDFYHSFGLGRRDLKGILSLQHSNYRFISYLSEKPSANKTATSSIALGIGCPITELWHLQVSYGARLSRSTYHQSYYVIEFPFLRLEETEKKASSQGSVFYSTLLYEGEKSTMDLSIAYDIQPSSARGGTTERTAYKFMWRNQINLDLHFTTNISYILNKLEALAKTSGDMDEESFRFNPSLHYSFNRSLTGSIAYAYIYSRDHVGGGIYHRNMFAFSVSYHYDILR